MKESLELIIKSSFFSRKKKLSVNPGFIEYKDKSDNDSRGIKIEKSNVLEFRYGTEWIRGYTVIIGRIYCIDIKGASGDTIKIRLTSLYGIGKQRLWQKHIQIVRALYAYYFNDISHSYLKDFSESQTFQILDVIFVEGGIYLYHNTELIEWDDLGTKAYTTYYALYSQNNPKQYKAFEYLTDWNTGILYSVSRGILMSKGLWEEQM